LIEQVPHLRIVDESLWLEVRQRCKNNSQFYQRSTNAHLNGRPVYGSPYLFTDFMSCEHCVRSLYVRSHAYGNRRTFHYACARIMTVDRRVVPSRLPMEDVDRAILDQIEQDISQPPIIAKTI
jgi:hypothetical protein